MPGNKQLKGHNSTDDDLKIKNYAFLSNYLPLLIILLRDINSFQVIMQPGKTVNMMSCDFDKRKLSITSSPQRKQQQRRQGCVRKVTQHDSNSICGIYDIIIRQM